MAGIAFQLKKLFKSTSIMSKLTGSLYASFTTIGPLILVILTLFTVYFFLGYNEIIFATRELLANTILYVFIFSLCTTAPFNAVLSRYISDKIFEGKENDILSSYYIALAINVAFSAIPGILFALRLIFIGNVEIVFVCLAYLTYMGLVIVFFTMTYITALKEYLKIFRSFVIGLGVSVVFSIVLHKVFGVNPEYAIIAGFALGFLIVAFLLFGLVRDYFKVNSRNYREVLTYYKIHWRLILINSLYTFGLYIHNFIFWFTDLQIVVADSFISAPAYDMATCIAMFINISVMVVFVVEVETKFHEKYQSYCHSVLGSTWDDIEYTKKELFTTINHGLIFIFNLQVIITLVLYLASLIVMPLIGVSTYILTIVSPLAVAYMVIFIMYNLIIFVYYFNVYNWALLSMAIFFVGTFIGTMITKNLTPNLFGVGVLVGAFMGLTSAFFSLRAIEKKLDYYIFCQGSLTNVVEKKGWSVTRYELGTKNTKS